MDGANGTAAFREVTALAVPPDGFSVYAVEGGRTRLRKVLVGTGEVETVLTAAVATDDSAMLRASLRCLAKKKGKKGAVDKQKTPTVDAILNNVFEEVLKARDRGESVSEEAIKQRAYEQTHEAVWGKKAFSADDKWMQSLPRAPLEGLRRLVPDTTLDEDPFPVAGRAPLPATNNAQGTPADVVPRFLDAVDELAHWELQLYEYVREHSPALRRALPLLMERYVTLVHRLKDAMLHFAACRDAVANCESCKLSHDLYSQADAFVSLPRDAVVECGKSMSGTFDPVKFAKAKSGKLMKLDAAGWKDWKRGRRAEQRAITMAYSGLADAAEAAEA